MIHTSSRVLSVDAQTATITLEDGTSHTGDFVIGGDGVHSKTRKFIISGTVPEVVRGPQSAFRFILERKTVLENPDTKSLVEIDGSMDLVTIPSPLFIRFFILLRYEKCTH